MTYAPPNAVLADYAAIPCNKIVAFSLPLSPATRLSVQRPRRIPCFYLLLAAFFVVFCFWVWAGALFVDA